MYTLVCTWHTYAVEVLNHCDDFHVWLWFSCFMMISINFMIHLCFIFWWFLYWAWLSIFMMICFSQHLYTHPTWSFLMTWFSWVLFVPYGFWVFSDLVIFMFHEKSIHFILKDFTLVFKNFHKLVHILHFGSCFQTYYILKSIFENPYHRWAVGWEIMLMYALLWKSF